MVDPVSVTVGAAVAALMTKAAETGGEQLADASKAAVGRLVGWLRDRFTQTGDEEGSRALARAEDAPDSPSRTAALAAVVDQRAAADPEFKSQVQRLVELTQHEAPDVGPAPWDQTLESWNPAVVFALAAIGAVGAGLLLLAGSGNTQLSAEFVRTPGFQAWAAVIIAQGSVGLGSPYGPRLAGGGGTVPGGEAFAHHLGGPDAGRDGVVTSSHFQPNH